MPKLPTLKYEEITAKMKRLGFRLHRQGKGSHEIWVRDADGKIVPVPKHRGKDIKTGTLRAIIREIGVSVEAFLEA
ncbi:MAG: type II toxin-antitoxin system HicA family toxin [Chloroherpetonaceae bacterium]